MFCFGKKQKAKGKNTNSNKIGISSFPLARVAQLLNSFQSFQLVQQCTRPREAKALFAVYFDCAQLLRTAEGAGFLLPEPGDNALPVEDMATVQLEGDPVLEANAALPQL